jgi:uncharacterized protein with HEPN domain
MSDSKDWLALKGILEAIEKIISFSVAFNEPSELFADTKSFDAVCMNFIVIGEMADRISNDFKDSHSNIDWKGIKGLRNIIVHDYFGIDADEIWSIIKTEMVALKSSIQFYND